MSGPSSESMTPIDSSTQPARESLSKTSRPLKDKGRRTNITLQVIKRNGKAVSYDPNKIRVAIMKAFIAVEGGHAAASTRIHEQVTQLTEQVTHVLQERFTKNGALPIETIQDQVELALMRAEAHRVARSYVVKNDAKCVRKPKRRQVHYSTFPIRMEHKRRWRLSISVN